VLERAWFGRDATVVAPDLLNKVLRVEAGGAVASGRIIETEAYLPDDPASHTFNGPTGRNRVMFGPAGHLYVYLSYGIHRCANVVTGVEGNGQAVLLRAIAPLDGIDVMRLRRGCPERGLSDGPGKLCQALGIELAHDGTDLLGERDIALLDDGTPPPVAPLVGPRVGISKAVDRPWRFRVPVT
jgi:DNA-3-methyladenine glycosylase